MAADAMGGRQWPVVIVGCGPVGLTLANLLGVYRVETLVLEREVELVDHPRAVGTDFDCLRAWQAIGLADELLKDMTPMGPDGLGMVYLDHRDRKFLEARPRGREFGFAFGYGFIQPLVDRALLDGLSRFPSVEVHFGHPVEEISQDDHRVRVSGRTARGTRFEAHASWVIACDGGRSQLRRRLGVRMRGSRYRQRWLVLDTLEPDSPERNLRDVEIRCDPERASVSVPRLYGHRRWEFRQKSGETEAELLEPETIRRLLARHTDPDRVHVIRKLVYPFSAKIADRFRVGRVLLAGDAAHVTPPFAAQGLASGIRDVFNLGWKLAWVVQGRAASSLLDSYERERWSHARASIRLAVWLGRIMMPGSRLQAALVQGVIRLLNRHRGFYEFMREAGPKPLPRYRDGFFFRPDARRGVVGHMLRQPVVLDPHGQQRKLDDLLGPGFALLGFDADPSRPLSPETRTSWETLGIRYLNVRGPGDRCRGPGQVQDTDGVFPAWLGPLNERLLLVRPDRFVAADVTHLQADFALQELAGRLRGQALPSGPGAWIRDAPHRRAQRSAAHP